MQNSTIRYPDLELEQFRTLIQARLEKATANLEHLQEQLDNFVENYDGGYDPDDMGNADVERDMLQTMIYRQQKHIRDLHNGLIRVNNKSYGICVITGQLIDKKRLMAVPTTTKSLTAKLQPPIIEKVEAMNRPPLQVKGERKILSKVISKKNNQLAPNSKEKAASFDSSIFTDWSEEDENWQFEQIDENFEEIKTN